MRDSTLELAIFAAVVFGRRGTSSELGELRRTVEQMKSELAKARDDDERYRSKLLELERQRRTPENHDLDLKPLPISRQQIEWLAHPAGNVGPRDTA